MLSKKLSQISASLLMFFAMSVVVCEASARDFTCPPKPAKAKKTRRLAGVYFKKGEQLFIAEEYNKAINRFLCSMTMVEHPNTVFNISQSAKAAKNKQRAYDTLNAYLEAHPDSTTATELQEVIDELADDLKLGKPKQEPAPPLPETEQETEKEADSSAPAQSGAFVRPLRIAGFVTAGAGVAGLVVGGIFLGLAASARADAENAKTFEGYQSNRDDWNTRNRVGTAVIITGSALAVTGGALILTSYLLDRPKDDTDSEGADVAVLPTMGGLVITGRF